MDKDLIQKISPKNIRIGSNKYLYACPLCGFDMHPYDIGSCWDVIDKQAMENWRCKKCGSEWMFVYDLAHVTQNNL